MGLLDQKLDAITQLKVTASLGQGLLENNPIISALRSGGGLKSLKTKNRDVVEFILDLMTLIFGPDFLQKTTNGLMKKVFKKNSSGKMVLEDKLKTHLLDALCRNDGDLLLPTDFYTTGYAVPVKALDLFDLFKLNPGNPTEAKLFGGANGFETLLFRQVLQNVNPQSRAVSFNALPNINFGYVLAGNAVNMSAAVAPNVTIEEFFRSILYAPGFKLLNPEVIAMEVLDVVMGYLSPRRTNRAIANEEVLRDIQDKISNEESIETVFTFNPKSLDDVNKRVKLRKAGGYTLNLGCNITNIKVTESEVLARIENQSDFANMFTSIMEKQLAADGTTLTGPIRDNFQRGLIKSLITVLLKHTLLNPRVWTLFVLSKIFQVGYPKSKYGTQINAGANTLADLHEHLGNRQEMVKSLTKTVRAVAIEYLTEKVTKAVIQILTPVRIEMAKEQVESYTKIIASFTPVITKINDVSALIV